MPRTYADNIGLSQSQANALYLKLDQTTPQTITGGKPIFGAGLAVGSASNLVIDLTGKLTIFASETDMYDRFQLSTSGVMSWGSGQDVFDTNLYRYAANVLKTDDAFTATNFVSTVAIGTQPYATTSTTLNTNLNADLLDGYHRGTAGDTYPLLSGANTWSGNQILNDNVYLYLGTGSDVKIYYSGTGGIFKNNDVTTADGTGKLQFYGEYIPTTGTGATGVGNYFLGTHDISALTLATPNSSVGNFFSVVYRGPQTTTAYAGHTFTGTYFQNSLIGTSTGSTNAIYTLSGVLFDTDITGTYTAFGMGINPYKIDIDITATINASHTVRGFDLEINYDANNSINSLYGCFLRTILTKGTYTGENIVYSGTSDVVSGVTLSNNQYIYNGFLNSGEEATFNTAMAAGKEIRIFGADAPSFNMAAHNTIGFWTSLPADAQNYAFKSMGADGWMALDNTGWVFGTGKDAKISFTGTALLIQSDIITATDELDLRGGTNGIDFLIGATEQISLIDGVLQPTTTNDIDLGTSSLVYKNAYITNYFAGSTAGISATVTYVDTLLGAKTLTFVKGILTAQT